MELHSNLLAAFGQFTTIISHISAVNIDINVPKNPKTRALLRDVVGYSIEPIWVDSYIRTRKASNLLSVIADITGKPPAIRIGGTTADQTYQHASLITGNASVAIPDPRTAKTFNITPVWYQTWSNYFPPETDFIYTLNFADNTSAWANAVRQAESACGGLGSKLKQFELGNEIDHYTNKGWRPLYPAWGVDTYIEQYRNLTKQITNSPWYSGLSHPPTFQAGVIADPPLIPDQHDEIDDFSIANLTANGTGGLLARPEDKSRISSLCVHLYPQSTCDTQRWHRMRLDLLSNHTVLWLNVSQFIPEIEAADQANIPLVMGETNSVSCGGRSGISDTFGAALWAVDYVLLGASLGFQKIFFHLGAQSEYSAFTPEPYVYKNQRLTGGMRSTWYSHYFVAKILATIGNKSLAIAALSDANSSTLAGYGIYAENALEKLVFLDVGVWNSTEGLSNPSTINVKDGKSFSSGIRPKSLLVVSTAWLTGQRITVTRLTAPGTNAKSNITVSGVTFDMDSGRKVGTEVDETLIVGRDGQLRVLLPRAEGILLELESRRNYL
jgi:hypothetical protein